MAVQRVFSRPNVSVELESSGIHLELVDVMTLHLVYTICAATLLASLSLCLRLYLSEVHNGHGH